ncbi:unnamed protein product [Urochloa humidicola]
MSLPIFFFSLSPSSFTKTAIGFTPAELRRPPKHSRGEGQGKVLSPAEGGRGCAAASANRKRTGEATSRWPRGRGLQSPFSSETRTHREKGRPSCQATVLAVL